METESVIMDIEELAHSYCFKSNNQHADMMLVAVAAYVANMLPSAGDSLHQKPVWMLINAGPACGKTYLLNAISNLPETRLANLTTEAALLSMRGGGMLAATGDHGMWLIDGLDDDLNSIAASHNLATISAAIREIYDGMWTRLSADRNGVEVQRAWHGNIGIIATSTSKDDCWRQFSTCSGERFLCYNMSDDDILGISGIGCCGDAATPSTFNTKLKRFIKSLDLTTFAGINDSEIRLLTELGSLASVSSPLLASRSLRRLLMGMKVIGLESEHYIRLLTRVATDTASSLIGADPKTS